MAAVLFTIFQCFLLLLSFQATIGFDYCIHGLSVCEFDSDRLTVVLKVSSTNEDNKMTSRKLVEVVLFELLNLLKVLKLN